MQTAKIFNNGRSQAVRLPKEFRFDDDNVFITKIGKMVILMPHDDLWSSFEAGIEQFSEDFMESREQPEQQSRDGL